MFQHKNYLLTCLFVAFSASIFAQDSTMQRFAKGIEAAGVKKHLEIIASDEYEGRETGKKGQKMAAKYIADHFKAIGLQGPVEGGDNRYYQQFSLEKSRQETFTLAPSEGETLQAFVDFFPYGKFEMDGSLELVFAGYGVEADSYSDYDQLDVKGKAVMMLEGLPTDKKGNSLLTEKEKAAASTNGKLRLAKEKGASLVVFVYKSDDKFQKKNKLFKHSSEEGSLGFPQKEEKAVKTGYVFTSPQKASQLMGIEYSDLKKTIKRAKKSKQSIAKTFSPTVIQVKATVATELVETENVLGFLPGTDKKEEVIVLTAHYDHIGVIDGKVYNGADDDGSGTVAIMEMATAFAKAANNGNRPRRSILFMAVTGEEKGLLGSQYYSEHPVFPLEKTVANLNTDMIGREDKAHAGNPDYVYLIGADMLSQDLHELSEEVAKRNFPDLALDYTYNKKSDPNRYYYRSDHYNFAKHNVPVIFYFNGVHPDYHKHTDTVDKINFEKIAKISRLIFGTAWTIANREERLELKADNN